MPPSDDDMKQAKEAARVTRGISGIMSADAASLMDERIAKKIASSVTRDKKTVAPTTQGSGGDDDVLMKQVGMAVAPAATPGAFYSTADGATVVAATGLACDAPLPSQNDDEKEKEGQHRPPAVVPGAVASGPDAAPEHVKKQAGVDDDLQLSLAPGESLEVQKNRGIGVFTAKADTLKEQDAKPEQAPPRLPEGHTNSQQINTGGMGPDSGVEFGISNTDESLAVALPIDLNDEGDEYIQASAVEYDPDAKPPFYRRRRFRLYCFLALFALIAAVIGVVIGIVVSDDDDSGDPLPSSDEPELDPREAGIQHRVESLVGSEEIMDPDSPYSKALAWITRNDTMQLLAESVNFVQRYVLAYFYFATTETTPWKSCNPSFGLNQSSDECQFARLIGISPLTYDNVTAVRWLSSQHECNWVGLICDESQQLREISLIGHGMNGPFPEGVRHLAVLQSLVFTWNALHGPLPANLVGMKHLHNMELHYNELSGTIPEAWLSDGGLARLNLGFNNLNGTISSKVGNARGLLSLFLQNNDLTGSIPAEIGALTSLTFLWLQKNSLTGSIPTEFSNMGGLNSVFLHKNKLSGSLPHDIGRLTALGELRLQQNSKLGGSIPDSFYDLNELWRLDLRRCNFTGPLSPRIGEMTNLEEFRLSYNPMNGLLPSEIGALNKVQDLQLDGTSFTGEVPPKLCERPGVEGGTTGVLFMTADCKPGEIEGPELACDCCTLCCDKEGLDCSPPFEGEE